ncbi:MAG: rod shape-determining protein MreD [Bacteroidales bacterium]|nr:rod shape-determining protein MreD [Bacteroidales bacterium]
MNKYLKYIFLFFFLIFFQILILNNIEISGYINPYFYIIFILILPIETPKWLLLISGFLLGFGIDIFSNTLGLNAFATVLVSFMRPVIINLLINKNDLENIKIPGIKSFRFLTFFIYSLILILIHNFTLFYFDSMKINEFFQTFTKALSSSVITLVLVILSDFLFSKRY